MADSTYKQEERRFWHEVFLFAIDCEDLNTPEKAGAFADEAMNHFHKRFFRRADLQEQRQAWDGYVQAALQGGCSAADALRFANHVLQERNAKDKADKDRAPDRSEG